MNTRMPVRIVGLAVTVAVVAAVTVWKPWDDGAAAVDPAQDRAIAEAVTTRTLTEELTVRGELRRDELRTINSAASGRISGIYICGACRISFGW